MDGALTIALAGNRLKSLEGVSQLQFLRYLEANQNEIEDVSVIGNAALSELYLVSQLIVIDSAPHAGACVRVCRRTMRCAVWLRCGSCRSCGCSISRTTRSVPSLSAAVVLMWRVLRYVCVVVLSQISSLEGLEPQQLLSALRLPFNAVSSLDEVARLRKLGQLRELDLRGNPIAAKQDYRAEILFM